jgi:hypothetical protein
MMPRRPWKGEMVSDRQRGGWIGAEVLARPAGLRATVGARLSEEGGVGLLSRSQRVIDLEIADEFGITTTSGAIDASKIH